jgi:hypothetical protein
VPPSLFSWVRCCSSDVTILKKCRLAPQRNHRIQNHAYRQNPHQDRGGFRKIGTPDRRTPTTRRPQGRRVMEPARFASKRIPGGENFQGSPGHPECHSRLWRGLERNRPKRRGSFQERRDKQRIIRTAGGPLKFGLVGALVSNVQGNLKAVGATASTKFSNSSPQVHSYLEPQAKRLCSSLMLRSARD